jgi:membrane protein YqaA with SNARE-associated domain
VSLIADAKNRIRRFQVWLESFAQRPHSLVFLFLAGMIEAACFPLSPDVLLIALGVARPKRSVLYALVVVTGSSLGALLGYLIGYALYDGVAHPLLSAFGAGDAFHSLLVQYRENAWLVVGLAGFTAIPFFVFTIAAGFNATLSPMTLFFAAVIGRTMRFLPLGILLHYFGPRVKHYFDHYLGRTLLVIAAILILMLLVARGMF